VPEPLIENTIDDVCGTALTSASCQDAVASHLDPVGTRRRIEDRENG